MNEPTDSRVIELVAEVLRRDRNKVTLGSRFIEDLEANSLDVVELVCLAEGEFDVRIPEQRIASIRTVGDVVEVLRESR